MTSLLGWTLVHACWQVAAVAAVVAAARSRIPAADAARRARAATGGLAAMLLVPAATGVVLGALTLGPGRAGPNPAELASLTPASTAAITVRRLAIDTSSASGWIVAAWLTGLAGAAALVAGGAVVERRRRRSARPAAARWRLAAARISRRLGLAGRVPVLVSAEVGDPALSGIGSPVVVIPAGLERDLDQDGIEAVLTHELSHVARRDHRVVPLLAAVRCAFFFHPAARWIGRVVEIERERATDARVLAAGIDPLVYARTLSHLEAMRRSGGGPRLALSARGGRLLERIRWITLGVPPSPRVDPLRPVAPVAVAALLWVGLGTVVPASVSVLRDPVMTIAATDPAGPFTLQFLDGRLVRAVIGGQPLGAGRWLQRGARVTIHPPGADPFHLEVRPDGISWRPRPAGPVSTPQR